MAPEEQHEEQMRRERWMLLSNIITLTRTPMTMLSLVWVALIIAALVSGLPPLLDWVSTAIWALFILDFLVQLAAAPQKLTYLRHNWITAISLALPAFALLRIFQTLRILRLAAQSGSFNLLRILSGINRGMEATERVIGHRRLGYVIALTVMLTFAGAAGMYAFENPAALRAQGFGVDVHGGAGLHSYGESVWWTAMVMTTLGSAYWPISLAGRILCFLLAIYALSVFGYITASIASYFIGGPAIAAKGGAGPLAADTAALESQVALMSERIATLTARLDGDPPAPPV